MAANKTTQNSASVSAFVDAIGDPERRADAKILIKLMKEATGETARMWGPSIIGFGSYHYVYESGREGDMPLVGFAPRKAAHVLYVHAGLLDPALFRDLGRHTTGKGCLYIKKLADIDRNVLRRLIATSVSKMREKASVPD